MNNNNVNNKNIFNNFSHIWRIVQIHVYDNFVNNSKLLYYIMVIILIRLHSK